jgi:hypothetical protein
MFSIRSVQVFIKKSSVENRHSSSAVPSEQSADSWALKMTLGVQV